MLGDPVFTSPDQNFQMLSPLDESELAAAWRRAAGPDGKVPVNIYTWDFIIFLNTGKVIWGC